MRLGRVRVGYLLVAALLLFAALVLTGCGSLGGPQNTFSPEGEVAEQQRDLFLLVMWPALVIMIGVFAAIIYLMVRYRRRAGDAIPEQIHGNMRLEITWTIIPTLLLIGIAVPTLIGIVDLGQAAGDDALDVTVEAIQWDWTFVYPEFTDAEGEPIESKTLYIPIDREIDFALESPDVIHSFWVPKLAGKEDIIPGRTNRMTFSADTPGTYSGQCAEFCGLQHSIMKFDVIAMEPAEFDQWVEDQQSGDGEAEPSPTASP